MVNVSDDAVRVYTDWYPGSTVGDLLDALDASTDIPPAATAALFRRSQAMCCGRHRLHPERSGVFLVAGGLVHAFFAFWSLAQHEEAVRGWPEGMRPLSETAVLVRAIQRDRQIAVCEALPHTWPSVRPGLVRGAAVRVAETDCVVVAFDPANATVFVRFLSTHPRGYRVWVLDTVPLDDVAVVGPPNEDSLRVAAMTGPYVRVAG